MKFQLSVVNAALVGVVVVVSDVVLIVVVAIIISVPAVAHSVVADAAAAG